MNNKSLKLYGKIKANPFGRFALWLLSGLYYAVTAARTKLYSLNILKSVKITQARVICIGNITTGGTGKTTGVIKAAELLSEAGVKAAIISRGYKRKAPKGKLTVLSEQSDSSWDQNHSCSWQEAGDEPYMMFNELMPYHVPVLISPNRVRAAKEAAEKCFAKFILMDDGFQHHKLHRDANIVLIDAKNPFGENRLLPLGTLREPLTALSRATLAVITHSDLVDKAKIAEITETVQQYAPDVQVLKSTHKPKCFLDVCKKTQLPLSALSGSAVAMSAIGEPQSFEDTLTGLGLNLEQVWRYPDHHPYTAEELATVVKFSQGHPIITTRKDFTKFPPEWPDIIKGNLYVLAITLDMSKSDMEKFEYVLLGGLITSKNKKEKTAAKKPAAVKKTPVKPSIEQPQVKTLIKKILNNIDKQKDLFGNNF